MRTSYQEAKPHLDNSYRKAWLPANVALSFFAMLLYSITPTYGAQPEQRTAAGKSYVVHVGAYAKHASARAFANRIRATDILTEQVEVVIHKSKGLYKVWLGPYNDRGKVGEIMVKLENMGIASVLGNGPKPPTAPTPQAKVASKKSANKSARKIESATQETASTEALATSDAETETNTLQALHFRLQELDARTTQLQQRLQQVEQRLAPGIAAAITPVPKGNAVGARDTPPSTATADCDACIEKRPVELNTLAASVIPATSFAQGKDVEETYQKTCSVCHAAAVGNAPKTGDADAWKPRLDKGMDVIVASVVNGLNSMPPQGMCVDCNEEDYAALIKFMATAKQ